MFPGMTSQALMVQPKACGIPHQGSDPEASLDRLCDESAACSAGGSHDQEPRRMLGQRVS